MICIQVTLNRLDTKVPRGLVQISWRRAAQRCSSAVITCAHRGRIFRQSCCLLSSQYILRSIVQGVVFRLPLKNEKLLFDLGTKTYEVSSLLCSVDRLCLVSNLAFNFQNRTCWTGSVHACTWGSRSTGWDQITLSSSSSSSDFESCINNNICFTRWLQSQSIFCFWIRRQSMLVSQLCIARYVSRLS